MIFGLTMWSKQPAYKITPPPPFGLVRWSSLEWRSWRQAFRLHTEAMDVINFLT